MSHANILDQLLDKVAAASILLDATTTASKSVNLFSDNMPDSPDNCLVLLEAPSPEPDKELDTQILLIDFWVRNAAAVYADESLQEIRSLFHRAANWDLPNFHVYFSQAVTNIQNLGRDSQSRQLRKLTIRFLYWDTAIIS